MEIVTLRFQESILKQIDKASSEHSFNSRTEFIREAVRDKLEELKREELANKFLSFRGKAKVKTSFEEEKRIKEKAGKELLEMLNKRFGTK